MEVVFNGYAAAAVAYAALGLFLLRRADPLKATPRFFRLAIWASALWASAAAAASVTHLAWAALGAGIADHLRYGGWFLCLLAMLQAAESVPSSMHRRLKLAALTLVALSVASVIALLFWRGDPGSVTRPSVVLFLALPVMGLVLVEQLYRNASEDTRWSQKPLCLALALLFVFDIYLFSEAVLFGRFDATAAKLRGPLHALAVPLLLAASMRHSAPRRRLRVSRDAAFHTVTLLLVGGYLVFVAGLGYYVRQSGGDYGDALQVGLVFLAGVALAALLLSGSMRAKLRVLLAKHFFTYRYDYRAEWLRFTEKLASARTPPEVGLVVVQGLADMVESPSGSLWTRSLDDLGFVQSARWNAPSVPHTEPADSPFCRWLCTSNWIVELGTPHGMPADAPALPEALAQTGGWLVVPLTVGERLVGLVTLGAARAAVTVDWEVRDLLKTASRQAAGFLAQMHATEALLEAKKFDAFNRMSAFVVHDLKNIITQLSLMMKNAQRLQDNPEFRQDMLATVEHSLEKMRQLMLQLREGDAPAGGATPVDLVRIAQRLAASAAARGRAVELSAVPSLATRGHEERVERVLGHVLQNALDATPPEGRVWLRLERQSGQACVEVGDTGRGMTPEFIRERLFKPFASTKPGGMGIGAYESFHYLRDLGGSIDVDSEVGRGTVIRMRLPLLELQQRSDLAEAVAK